MKREVKIKGTMDMGSLRVGQNTVLILENGDLVRTSKIVTPPFVGGGVIRVETQNSVYCNY